MSTALQAADRACPAQQVIPRLMDTLNRNSRRVAVFANPIAGRRNSASRVALLLTSLEEQGLEPVLCSSRQELPGIAAAFHQGRLRCIVAVGGDGTLAEVVNQAPGTPVALLPAGNENLAARECQLGRCEKRLAELITEGRARQVDLGRANGRLFILMAGAGFEAEVVHRTHGRRQGHINKLSYVVPLLQSWRQYDFAPIHVEIADTGERLQGSLVLIFNLPQYALRLPIARQAVGDDGLLDLHVFERPGRWELIRYLAAVLCGRQDGLPDHHRRRVRRLVLTSPATVPLQTDGDPAGSLPVTVEAVPRALTLVVPPMDRSAKPGRNPHRPLG